jgi:uridine phosphorylase
MPARLRPTAPIAADAILVGDPGRALMLAQALLEQPQMSNHARGLWGYSGETPAGHGLTIQSTGMGGPSAAIVLGDLAALGVRRAIRVGTCTATAPDHPAGELVVVAAARGGGTEGGRPDRELTASLTRELGVGATEVRSLDRLYQPGGEPNRPEAGFVDMQTAALLRRGAELGVAVGVVLIVSESDAGALADEELEAAARRAGEAAAGILSA